MKSGVISDSDGARAFQMVKTQLLNVMNGSVNKIVNIVRRNFYNDGV
jgi:hypothetical protein